MQLRYPLMFYPCFQPFSLHTLVSFETSAKKHPTPNTIINKYYCYFCRHQPAYTWDSRQGMSSSMKLGTILKIYWALVPLSRWEVLQFYKLNSQPCVDFYDFYPKFSRKQKTTLMFFYRNLQNDWRNEKYCQCW